MYPDVAGKKPRLFSQGVALVRTFQVCMLIFLHYVREEMKNTFLSLSGLAFVKKASFKCVPSPFFFSLSSP